MSFSGTPLGQDRRLDHQSFLKGSSLTFDRTQSTTSPPRRVGSLNSVPLSYAYGAPSFSGSHSPNASPRARRNASPSRVQAALNRPHEGEDEEQHLNARYVQLKQRNQILASRPGSSLGPGVIATPPQPSAATLKDTSVNIASAFQQAASSYGMNSNSSWTNGQRANLPRSTSVEYEEQSRSTSHRRLAVPPSRAGGRTGGSKPVSKAGSTSRGSDAENERNGESVDANGRAKSPFDALTDFARKTLAPASIYMKQRSRESEADDMNIPDHNHDTASYDYAEEEAEFQDLERKKNSSSAAAHKRNRMSVDNKAYRPTVSDLEESSEEQGEERKGRRRKAKKKDVGGPLNTLPVAQYDKRKKRKGRSGKGDGSLDDEVSISDEHSSEHAPSGGRSTTPLQRHASVPRGSIPPSHGGSVPPTGFNSFDTSGATDMTGEMDSGLQSIPEETELSLEDSAPLAAGHRRAGSRSRSVTSKRPAFSIGVFLGSIVNRLYRLGHGIVVFIFRILAMVTLLIGRLLGAAFDIVIRQPTLYVRGSGRRSMNLGKYIVAAVALYLAWYALQHPTLLNVSVGKPSRPHFTVPDYPPGTVEELNARILHLENMIADLRSDTQSSRHSYDSDLRKAREIVQRVSQLESRIDKEIIRAQQNEEETRISASRGLETLQRELRTLKVQSEDATQRSEGGGKDEDARAKLQALEDRLESVEGDVKDAIELGQSAVKAGSLAASTTSGSHWWNKLGSGSSSSVTIKTGDGQDVTSLIEHVVENSVAHYRKDDLARVDFALGSGGAGVIPSLTSPTYNLKKSHFFGLVTGAEHYFRPPATALHHELHLGYCWPFSGPQGQLGVALAHRVLISDITIDHVAKEIAHDMRSAPRNMEVWAQLEGAENKEKYAAYEARRMDARSEGEVSDEPSYPSSLPKSKDVRYVRIASFDYNIHSPYNTQTYTVDKDIQDLGIDFGLVVLMVNSNWGQEDFTCLYRFRVHGNRLHEAPSPDL